MITLIIVVSVIAVIVLAFLLLWRNRTQRLNILFSSPFKISLAIFAIIFITEAGIMFFLAIIRTQEIDFLDTIIDAVILSLITIPIIYRWLKKQEKQIHSITDNTVDSIITINSNGRIEYFNHASEQIFGYNASEVIGKNVSILMPEPDSSEHDRYIDDYLRTGTPKIIGLGRELLGKRKNGEVFPIYLAVSEVRNNNMISFVGIIQDITERKKTEEELRQSNDKFQDFFYLNPEPSAITTIDGVFIYTNQALMDMSGYSKDEIIGKNVKDLNVWWDMDDRDRMIKELLEKGTIRSKEIKGRTKSGKLSYAIYSAQIIMIGGKQHILFIMQDINELKAAEDIIKKSEARYRLLVESSPLCIHEIDMDGRLISMNKAGLVMMGVDDEQAIRGMSYLDAVCDADRKRIEELLLNSYLGEAAYFEFKANGPGGLIFRSCFIPLKDTVGNVYKLMGITEDITERKLAEERVRTLNEQLEAKVKERTAQLEVANKELEAFTYSVSHDLRAPLRSIDSFNEAIMEDYGDKLGADGKNYIQRAHSAIERMNTLIDDLLSLSRITRGELNRTSVNLSSIASSIINPLRESEPVRVVEVKIAENMLAEADPHLMEIALTNLLYNAWKYTSKKEKAKIEFGCTEKDGKIVYYVRDNGAGFDINYASKMFQPFQRLHTAEEFSGTGIGLATVYRIIKKHGGDIWAEGKVGEGAAFYFTLENN